jgi:PAS domain S-box-containing protein
LDQSTPPAESDSKKIYVFLERLKIPALLLVVLMYVLVIIFYFMDNNVKYNPNNLIFILNLIFVFIPSLFIAFIALRSFLRTGNWPVLCIGLGTLSFGVAALLSFLIAMYGPINAGSTNFPIIIFFSGLSYFVASLFLISRTPPQEPGRERLTILIMAIIGSIIFYIIFTLISLQNILPPFFIQGEGSTPLRQIILVSDSFLFIISGSIIYYYYLKTRSVLHYWLALGLFLIFLVLIGNLLVIAVGTPLNWTLRITQLLSGIYLFIAALVIMREAKVHHISAADALAKFFQMRESNLNLLLNSVTDGIIVTDPNFIITGWNKGAEQIYKWEAEEAIGNSTEILKTTYSGFTKQEVLNQIIKDGKWSGEYQQNTKDGNEITILGSISTITDDWNEMIGYLSVSHDFTERKKYEKALEVAHDKLESKVQELKRSNQDLERFAYVSSHDLQEPLRMVILYSQLLDKRYKDKLDNDANEFIEFIVDGAQHMRQLIDDLLAYSRVTNKANKFENVDMEILLKNVIANLSITIEENSVNITHDPLPTIFADPVQMGQIFQNLITNSIKFHGSHPPKVHISAKKGDKEWIFSVKDNGIGIDPKHQNQIFEIFKRLHTKKEYVGSGIGLSIVKKIIIHHGGRVWVESNLGKGSTFYFTIPLR